MSGTVIIENIFLVPGMGRLMLDSIFQRDYAVTQAAVMIVTIVVVFLNLLTDLLYGWLDPRIRYQ
jgi:ABC-type dipeptide/oligopeptide/nickel transport system permease component